MNFPEDALCESNLGEMLLLCNNFVAIRWRYHDVLLESRGLMNFLLL